MINFKLGFATNSSSYHSTIILRTKEFEELLKGGMVDTEVLEENSNDDEIAKPVKIKTNLATIFCMGVGLDQKYADTLFYEMNKNWTKEEQEEMVKHKLDKYNQYEIGDVTVLSGEIYD